MARKRFNLKHFQKKQTENKAPLVLPTRILGIDAALRRTGYGIVEIQPNGSQDVLDCGVITTSKNEPLSQCLRRLRGGIRQIIEKMDPDAAALESGFFHKNAKTAMALGAARGVALCILAEYNIPIFEYAPRLIKQAICGYGNAGKEQIALMTAQLLNFSLESVNDDATDALAAALCHAGLATTQNGLFLPEPS